MTTEVSTFDFSVDVMSAILWRHNNATRLQALLQSKNDWYEANHTQFWENWITDVFDLATANEFGCSVWAVILGLPTSLVDVLPIKSKIWGFGPFNQNFSNGNFSNVTSNPGFLSIAETRQILQLRYYQLTSSGKLLQTNQQLANVFGEGQIYLKDNLNMTCNCYIGGGISETLQDILQDNDLIPRASGVKFIYIVVAFFDDGGVLCLSSPDSSIPSSPVGLSAGAIWSNDNLLCVAGTTTPNPLAPPVYYETLSVEELISLTGANFPLTPSGPSGSLWNNSGVISIVS